MARNIVAGLDLGTSAIRLVVVETGADGRPGSRVIAQIKQESRGLRRGYIVNFDETLQNLREALREAERQTKFRLREVYLGIGGITLEATQSLGQVMAAKADLEIGPNDVERALEAAEANLTNLANRRVIHAFPLSFKLDGNKVLGRPEGLKGQKLEVQALFTHCLSQHVKDLEKVINAAGVAVADIVAAPLAASVATLSLTQKMAGCLLANIGSQTTSLITFEDGLPLSLQVLPFGSNDITNDIALGLAVSLDEAERLKLELNSGGPHKRKLDEIIEARLSDIFELIENHLKKIKRNGLLPAGVIIVGAGSHVDNIEQLARKTLGLPAKLFDPTAHNHLKTQIRDAAWVVAYGLCLYGQSNVKPPPGFSLPGFGPAKKRFLAWLQELLP